MDTLASAARRMTAVVLALCLCAPGALLSGCKYTDVLTEHIEDPVNGQLDETAEPLYQDVADAEEDPTRTSSKVSASDRVDDQKRTRPNYDENQDRDDETEDRQNDATSSNTQAAVSGTLPSEGEETSTADEEEGDDDGPSEGEEQGDEPSDEADASDSVPGDDGQGGDEATGGTGGPGKVYDDGTYTELPTDVGTVAAVGQYATIVQMLCGAGGLVAADRKWINTVSASAAFPDEETEGISRVRAGWSGDGTAPASAKMSTLIAAAPDAVLYESGSNALTEEQQEQLVEEGIDVVVVPQLGRVDTPDADVLTAVNVVAELLKKAETTYDASAMASTYAKLHDATLDACLTANGGYTAKMVGGATQSFIYQGTDVRGTATTNLSNNRYVTSFVDSWTSAVRTYTTAVRRYSGARLYLDGETMDASEGMGLSAAGTTDNFMLLDYYLQVSGVMNNAYDTSRPAVSGTEEGSAPYLVIPGTGESLAADSTLYTQRTAPSALWLSLSAYGTSSTWTTVGDVTYPALLCRTEAMAKKVAASAARTNGLYNVGQPYEVWVLPSGLAGSWADGTVESFLAAPWTYCMFQLGQDLATCSEYASSYYLTFYRCEADDIIENYHTVYQAVCPTSQP